MQVLKSVYFPNSGFIQASRKRSDSWVWASLMHGKEVIVQNARWMVGKGQMIDISRDRWVAGGCYVTKVGNSSWTMVQELMDLSNRCWDVVKIRENFNSVDAFKILQTPISWTSNVDYLYWPHARSGVYSVKSGYYALKRMEEQSNTAASSLAGVPKDIWRVIWGSQVPQKIKHFLWKACSNILPVRGTLKNRRICREGVCPICEKEEETVEHLLLFCEWTILIWFGSQLQSVPNRGTISSLFGWLEQLCEVFKDQKNYLKYILNIVFCNLWVIWKNRNKAVFEQIKPDAITTSIQAQALITDSQKQQEAHSEPASRGVQSVCGWRPPREGIMKINTDAAFSTSSKIGYAGIIGRDEKRLMMVGITNKYPVATPLLAEAMAFREAFQAAANLGIKSAVFETDCLTLIRACREEISVGEILVIVNDINHIRSQFDFCGITWTSRKGNEAAHSIANLAKNKQLLGNWYCSPPPHLLGILSRESAFSIPRSSTHGQIRHRSRIREEEIYHEQQPPGSDLG